MAPRTGRGLSFCCHRATLSGRFPENSLAAVDECVGSGATRLEVDVQFLADDTPVVFHDRDLDRLTTGNGPLAALSLAGASHLRLRAHPDVGLPLLDEIVDVMNAGATALQVDLKRRAPIADAQVEALVSCLDRLRVPYFVGCEAHWNLRPFVARGVPVAFDPNLHWHHLPDRRGEGLLPACLGLHGLWDDAPLAHVPAVPPGIYVRERIADLVALVPGAVEWMVHWPTVLHLSALWRPLGDLLAERGIALSAWTLADEGPGVSRARVEALSAAGVTTVITDAPLALAGHCAFP